MKLHASVGADILSAIEFPYPVVPIVRHHHENWDGTGYPAGLRGTEIPIGARILSVVDCFDALTSDRPYRPRLSDAEAIAILLDRRGTMYDPLVVDTFLRVYRNISQDISSAATLGRSFADITGVSTQLRTEQQVAGLENITAGSNETLAIFDLARALARLSASVARKPGRQALPSTVLTLSCCVGSWQTPLGVSFRGIRDSSTRSLPRFPPWAATTAASAGASASRSADSR